MPLGIVEAESGQVVGEREDGALDGEVMVGRVNVIRGGGEEEAGEDHVDGLGQDLLPDAQRGAGVELTLIEVCRLLELEEFLGLPPQAIELGDLRSREVRPSQRGEMERLVALRAAQLDGAQLDCAGATPRVAGRQEHDAVVVTATLLERGDGVERVRRRDPDEEVDLGVEQDTQHFVGRITAPTTQSRDRQRRRCPCSRDPCPARAPHVNEPEPEPEPEPELATPAIFRGATVTYDESWAQTGDERLRSPSARRLPSRRRVRHARRTTR